MARVASLQAVMAAMAVGLIVACGPVDTHTVTPADERSSPFTDDFAACLDGLTGEDWFEGEQAGDPALIRCVLTSQDQAPISFNHRYLLYRIEGVEPEGLDAIVRGHGRVELAARIVNLHERYDYLGPVEFQSATGCRMFDATARELLSRTPPPPEPSGCERWGL
jgi:hypothetical protein